jgi:hypothetical protein
MSEQAPRGDLGGNTIPDTWLGLTCAELEDLPDRRSHDIFIAQYDSDRPSVDRTVTDLKDSVDNLLLLFGHSPTDWQQHAMKVIRSNMLPPALFREQIQAVDGALGAGPCLLRRASSNLCIEDEEEGIGTTGLIFALSPSLRVTLLASGDHWSGSHTAILIPARY